MEKGILELFKRCASKVEDELKDNDERLFAEKLRTGADGTPVKGIDDVAESAAIDHLTKNCDCDILSEESGLVENGGDGTVIMDPVDGTTNALLGIPFYCISIAYTESDDLSGVVVGYVKNLISGKEYYAISGEGSYCNGQEIVRNKIRGLNFSVYLGKKAHPDNFHIASLPDRTRSLGSAALEICLVAEGVLDLYYMRTKDKKRSLRITDIAAAKLILEESGGNVYDDSWDTINMKLDPKEREDVIAINDEKIREVIG